MLFGILFDVFDLGSQLLKGMVFVLVVLSLLFSFNVINGQNTFLLNLYNGLDRLLEPLLRPLRRLLPNTGGMDFSPLILLMLIELIRRALIRYAMMYLL